MSDWRVVLLVLFALSCSCGPGGPVEDGGVLAPSSACTGEASECGSFVEAGCNAQDGCTWVGDLVSGQCTGVVTPCEQIAEPDYCAVQEGCEWTD